MPFPEQIDLAYALQDVGRTKEARQAFEAVLADRHASAEDRASATKALAEQGLEVLFAEGDKALDGGDKAEAQRIDELPIAVTVVSQILNFLTGLRR